MQDRETLPDIAFKSPRMIITWGQAVGNVVMFAGLLEAVRMTCCIATDKLRVNHHGAGFGYVSVASHSADHAAAADFFANTTTEDSVVEILLLFCCHSRLGNQSGQLMIL